ncbi:MAG: D-glycero-alpha-D-manno-heptose-1,7-bisphosphate 7-phosphatase [Bacteriovoracia bacterium]
MALREDSAEKAIFFDKDGTLVENIPFNVDPDKIAFSSGALLALSSLKSLFQFHIVSNQAGVALGKFRESELKNVKLKMMEMFREAGAMLMDFHYCPHHPEGSIVEFSIDCTCRKPGTGMLEKAAHKYGIDLRRSWMIGDILDDVECGRRAGCRTILIDNGNETKWELNDWRRPHFKVRDLGEAALIILNEEC